MRRFLWKPVAVIIEERRAASESTIAQANAQARAADEARAEVEHIRKGLAEERETALAEAHADADEVRRNLLTKAKEDADKIREQASESIETDHQVARKEAINEAGALALDIAIKLANHLKAPVVRAAFLDDLATGIAGLPEETRRTVAVSDGALRLISAETLDENAQEECRRRISEAFGCSPEMSFAADPALIEGFELHGAHFSILNSWRADLARIEESLRHE